jgi:hypothetical protein
MDVVKVMQAIVDGMVARPGAQALVMDNFTVRSPLIRYSVQQEASLTNSSDWHR